MTTEQEKQLEVWNNLDPVIQECALEPFPFTNKLLKLNQRGMIELIKHLEKYNLEIKKK